MTNLCQYHCRFGGLLRGIGFNDIWKLPKESAAANRIKNYYLSIGFSPDYILTCARGQSFQLGRCIYDASEQEPLIEQIVNAVETLAVKHGENLDESKRH